MCRRGRNDACSLGLSTRLSDDGIVLGVIALGASPVNLIARIQSKCVVVGAGGELCQHVKGARGSLKGGERFRVWGLVTEI